MASEQHAPIRQRAVAGLSALVCALGLAGLIGAPAEAALPIVSSPAPVVSSAAAGSTAGTYVALTPARFLDTRTGYGGSRGLHSNQTADLRIAGRGSVPASGVGAVVLDVTVAAPTAFGYLTVYPSHVAIPAVSDLSFYAGRDIRIWSPCRSDRTAGSN